MTETPQNGDSAPILAVKWRVVSCDTVAVLVAQQLNMRSPARRDVPRIGGTRLHSDSTQREDINTRALKG